MEESRAWIRSICKYYRKFSVWLVPSLFIASYIWISVVYAKYQVSLFLRKFWKRNLLGANFTLSVKIYWLSYNGFKHTLLYNSGPHNPPCLPTNQAGIVWLCHQKKTVTQHLGYVDARDTHFSIDSYNLLVLCFVWRLLCISYAKMPA